MLLDTLNYSSVEGSRNDKDIVIYSLSTCGFCKRAMTYLKDKGFSYRYIHLDQTPLETKSEVKRLLKASFNEDVAFPFAVIDKESYLVGFIEEDWKRTLGL